MKKVYLQAKFNSKHPEIKSGEWTLAGRHEGYDMDNERDIQVLVDNAAYYERNKEVWNWEIVQTKPAPRILQENILRKVAKVNDRFYKTN